MSVLTGSSTPARRRGAVLALALALGALTACSGNSSDNSSAAGTTTTAADTSGSAAATSARDAGQPNSVDVTEKNFRIALDNSNLSAGDYSFTITNQDQATHNLAIEKDGQTIATSAMIQPGQTGTLTASLQPGSYVFYCGVGAHRKNGMELDVNVS